MEKSSFFKSIAGDRKYKVEDFAAFFSSLVTNGVFPNPSTNLQVIANNNMTVTIKAGKAWVNGYVYINDSDLIKIIEVADGVLKRIDRLVVQYSTINREIKIKVKKGTFASTPVAPVLVRDADLYELGIADIYVANGAVSIVGSNITDLRMNTSLCGWVNSLIQADTTAIFNQYQAWFTAQSNTYNTEMIANQAVFRANFEAWFATIQGQLSGDIAGNLAASISNLAGTGRSTQTVKGNADAIAATNTNVANLSTSVATSLAEIPTFQTAGGTATAITLTGITLANGFSKTFIASATSTSTSKTINGKPFYKPATVLSPSLTIGKAYTVWYNLTGDCFFIKASATGSTIVSKVLAGETFSTEDDTDLVGTIPSKTAQTFTPSTSNQTIALGQYLSGAQTILGDADLIASNIVNTANIFNIQGTAIEGKRWKAGTFTTSTTGVFSITGLLFTPTILLIYTNQFNSYMMGGIGVYFKSGTPIKNISNVPTNAIYANQRNDGSTNRFGDGGNGVWGASGVTNLLAGVENANATTYGYYIFE